MKYNARIQQGATLGNRQNNKKALENNFLVSKKKKKKKKPKQKLYSTGKHKYLQVIRNKCNERIRYQKLWDKPEFGKMYGLNAYIGK